MSKPILSELEYNASDVASAILVNLDLSIANEDLGVTTKTDNFSLSLGFVATYFQAYRFNGFMFISGGFKHDGGAPSNGEIFLSCDDSGDYPISDTFFLGHGYQGDNAYMLNFNSDGEFKVHDPIGTGESAFYFGCNGFYRIT